MAGWARTPEDRNQMVLFPEKLDDIIPPDATVRVFDEILSVLDFSEFEKKYDLTRGQPPIHPRVLASVILYGLLQRIRSTRRLEEALIVRNDFRWLAQGFSLDHSTLAVFRVHHTAAIQDLFVQVVRVARNLGLVQLQCLAFDGTRIQADNRRGGTRTPEELRQEMAELQQLFEQQELAIQQADDQEKKLLGAESTAMPKELTDRKTRLEQIAATLQDLEQQRAQGGQVPQRIPNTDLDARIMKNKEGGFAPNYTPTATVDVASGVIVDVEVVNNAAEDHVLLASVDNVTSTFGVRPEAVLMDGLNATGFNLAGLEERGITAYSPLPAADYPEQNPALRDDLTQPVAAELIDQLPTQKMQGQQQFKRAAFVYDAEQDAYFCPAGQKLEHHHAAREPRRQGTVVRERYVSRAVDCAACPLKQRCLQGQAQTRSVSHDQHEGQRRKLAARMKTQAGKQKYAQRRHAGETPFAWIKQRFHFRRFLVRGLARVKNEWRWAATSFNLCKIMSYLRANLSRAGPLAAS